MQINWIELRNKKTGLTIKKSVFGKVNCLTGEQPEAIAAVFDGLEGARDFALGHTDDTFLDIICRINFHVSHNEYLWYAKNTADEANATIVDEEELYDQDNNMLLRRSFKEAVMEGYGILPPINLTKSALYLFNNEETLSKVTLGFAHMHSYHLTSANTAAVLAEVAALPHGAVALLDASALVNPLDLQPLTNQRIDIQIFANNCTNGTATPCTVTQKGQMIGCK